MPIYRYRLAIPLDLNRLNHLLPSSATLSASGPDVFVDLAVDAGSKSDLDAVLEKYGYSFSSQDPSDTPTEQAQTAGNFAVATTQVVGGAGLTGGGDLSTDHTLNVVANADGSIVVNADDIQVGVLASDAQHGNRGSAALHSVATTSVAGFLSAADKTKLDSVASNAVALTSSAPTTILPDDTASVGSGTTAARSDHTHAIVAATPSDVGTSNTEGSSTSFARADHTHNLPFSAVNTALAAANADIAINTHKITGVVDPTSAQHAATKNYVDAQIQTGIQILTKAVTLANLQALGATASGSISVGTAATNARFLGGEIETTQALAGGLLSAAVASVEQVGETAGAIQAASTVRTVGTRTSPGTNPFPSRGGQALQTTITLTGTVFSSLTAGAFTVRLFYAVAT